MTLWFPDKPEVHLDENALVAVFTAYKEQDRLPYFLKYYRDHGVSHFFAIDNASTDGTAEFLRAQADVTCFLTTASYAASNAGRLWTTELARHYATGRWCLTLDVDELLVFPGSEHITIRTLAGYLDLHRYQALFTVFLDMYGRGRLSEAVYAPGQAFLDVCDRYEVESYTVHAPITFPWLQVYGGPRQRIFRDQGNAGMGPSMRKLPLMKWTDGADYIFSTHSCRPCRLADITGATLHFKFFSSFKHLAKSEVARGDRRQMDHYRQYANALEDADPVFENPQTKSWSGTPSLVRDGLMVSTAKWAGFLRDTMPGRKGREAAGELRDAQKQAESRAVLRLDQLPLLWPMFNRDLTFRLCEVRDNRIVAILRETTSESPSRLVALDEHGERLAEAEPLSAEGLLGLSEAQQRFLVQIRLPETRQRQARTLRLVLEPSMEALATISIEPRNVAPPGLIGACVPGEGTKLRVRFEGHKFELNDAELSLYVDGEWRALIPVRLARERTDRGSGRERRYLEIELGSFLREGSTVEAYFARQNARLRKSPLEFRNGVLKRAESQPSSQDQKSPT